MNTTSVPPRSQIRLIRAYVEIAKVIQFYRVDDSLACWQQLADRLRALVVNSADGGCRSDNRRLRPCSPVRGLPLQSFGPVRETCAHAPQGGAEQQRQAADRGIGEQHDPGRQGQNEGRSHGQDPDGRRQEHESSDHFLQPPREACSNDARPAWQEYGQALVKVRLAFAPAILSVTA